MWLIRNQKIVTCYFLKSCFYSPGVGFIKKLNENRESIYSIETLHMIFLFNANYHIWRYIKPSLKFTFNITVLWS